MPLVRMNTDKTKMNMCTSWMYLSSDRCLCHLDLSPEFLERYLYCTVHFSKAYPTYNWYLTYWSYFLYLTWLAAMHSRLEDLTSCCPSGCKGRNWICGRAKSNVGRMHFVWNLSSLSVFPKVFTYVYFWSWTWKHNKNLAIVEFRSEMFYSILKLGIRSMWSAYHYVNTIECFLNNGWK